MIRSMVVVTLLHLLLLLLVLVAVGVVAGKGSGLRSFNQSLVAAVDTNFEDIMHVVRAHRPRRFSYCLRRRPPQVPSERRGFLRMDGEVPSTAGMPHAPLLYNADHGSDYGPYFVELVGVSVGGRMLEGIDADTFRRNVPAGTGGTVLNVGAVVLYLVQPAYDALERAVEQHLRPAAPPRVGHHPYSFCVRGATGALWQHIPEVALHFRDPRAVIRIPPSDLFVGVNLDACMTVLPSSHMTVVGFVPQLEKRFTFDLDSGVVFFAPQNCELDTGT